MMMEEFVRSRDLRTEFENELRKHPHFQTQRGGWWMNNISLTEIPTEPGFLGVEVQRPWFHNHNARPNAKFKIILREFKTGVYVYLPNAHVNRVKEISADYFGFVVFPVAYLSAFKAYTYSTSSLFRMEDMLALLRTFQKAEIQRTRVKSIPDGEIFRVLDLEGIPHVIDGKAVKYI